jgi:ubiquinone/menaquinone biosynthesis C-methylase UbiE
MTRAEAGPPFAFSVEGLALAKELDSDYEQAGFGEWMTNSEKSPTYAEFCRRAHGTDFIQFNMIDAEQIERLLEFLDLKAGDRLADLGCGIGTQAEYISDRTGAVVTGLDFSEAAIARASERTTAKRDRLSFMLGDLNSIDLPPGSFDAAVVFDTLYFVEDLGKTVADIARLLAPGGRLAIFYSEMKGPEDAKSILKAEGTRLATALQSLGLTYKTIDFSSNEKRFWTDALKAATELKAAFESEGNLELWKTRDAESRYILSFYDSGTASRHLYMVTT